MIFNEEQLMNLVEEVCTNEDIKTSDIPCVDLYMDQVTSFFDDKLCMVKRDDQDKILTKTMINNYAKAKILFPVKNKKYTKENIMLLTLIYNLKQTLSINDISTLIMPLLNELENKDGNNEYTGNIYSQFLDIKKGEQERFKEDFEEKINKIKEINLGLEEENEQRVELLLTVLLLINGANLQKRMAEKIIDNFFKPSKNQGK